LQVEFRNKNLLHLYENGKSRKYNLSQEILKKFLMRIQQLEAALNIYDLWKSPSLNFEKLQGHESKYSMRLDKTWRLEMEIRWEDKEKTKGIINIVELSKHYGD